jgi:hypothetical protein
MKSTVDARAGRGRIRSGGGSFGFYSDALYRGFNLGYVVGLVKVASVVLWVAHADGAQHLSRLTESKGWIV